MRAERFFRRLPARLYLLLLAVVVFSFFSNDFGLVDIQKTAIILSAGIDRSEDGFYLTAQIAVPKGGTDGGGTNAVNVCAAGDTLPECVEGIYAQTGWVPKFIFCDLLLLGEAAAEKDAVACLDFFLRSEYMPDSSLVAVCEGTAHAVLSTQSAVDEAASLAVEKLFTDAAEKSGRVCKMTLREFAAGCYGVTESGYMPYLSALDAEQTGSAGGESGQGGQDGQSAEKEPPKVYTAARTALFFRGRMQGVLTPQQTLAFQLLRGKVYAGTVTAEAEGSRISLGILQNDGGIRLDVRPLRAEFSVTLHVHTTGKSAPDALPEISRSAPSRAQCAAAENAIAADLTSLFKTCEETGCDMFGLGRTLHRLHPDEFSALHGPLLGELSLSVRVRVFGAG